MLAVGALVLAVLLLDLKMRLQLAWRHALAGSISDRWLAAGRHYELKFVPGDHGGVDQRIADDARIVTEIVVDLGAGIVNAALMLIVFVGVLWGLSGALTLPIGGGMRVEGYMVWAALLYAGIGTCLTALVGRPLPDLAAAKLAAEGEYRFQLLRAQENSEGIALMRGEADERRLLEGRFSALAERWAGLRRGTCRVAWLTTAYALMGVVFPALVASPMYLSGEMTLGGLMQAVAAMVHVQTALSWFVDNFPRVSDLRASAQRIRSLLGALDDLDGDSTAPDDARIVVREGDEDVLRLRSLDIAFPDGDLVVAGADTAIRPGEKVLIIGESGSGKSTLLRAVAGVWPWGRGEIHLPRGARPMFMPQRPYFPLGRLDAALAYPLPAETFPQEAYRAVLDRCGLADLVARLPEIARWDQMLSGGEQQRLAFARLLLHQPDWVFLDEATSALDEAGQADMMSLFRSELVATAVVSIGHRPGLEAMHDRTMTLLKGADSARLVRGRRAQRAARRPRGQTMSERIRRTILQRLPGIGARARQRGSSRD